MWTLQFQSALESDEKSFDVLEKEMNDDLKQLKENEKKYEHCLYLKLDNNNHIKADTLNSFEKTKRSINQLI